MMESSDDERDKQDTTDVAAATTEGKLIEEDNGKGLYLKHLEELLAYVQKSVVNYNSLSENLHSDLLPGAEELSKQLQPQLNKNLQDLFGQLLEEYRTPEKLQQLEQLRAKHRGNGPAWKHSGIAEEDYTVQADVTARLLHPQFEELHSEVVAATGDLWRQQQKLEDRLKELEKEIDLLTYTVNQDC